MWEAAKPKSVDSSSGFHAPNMHSEAKRRSPSNAQEARAPEAYNPTLQVCLARTKVAHELPRRCLRLRRARHDEHRRGFFLVVPSTLYYTGVLAVVFGRISVVVLSDDEQDNGACFMWFYGRQVCALGLGVQYQTNSSCIQADRVPKPCQQHSEYRALNPQDGVGFGFRSSKQHIPSKWTASQKARCGEAKSCSGGCCIMC